MLQIAFWAIVFGRIFYKKSTQTAAISTEKAVEGISIVICGRNEAANFKQFLPAILQQNYPLFEVIVVNDASDDNSDEVLRAISQTHFQSNDFDKIRPQLQIITLENDGTRLLQGKKHALTVGINSAKYNWILVTDADCAPVSPNWASVHATRMSFTATVNPPKSTAHEK